MATTKTTQPEVTQAEPDTYGWIEEFRETYLAAAAHSFILTGDVYGLTVGGQRPQLTLEILLANSKGIVIRYNRARGFSFLKPSMRAKAAKLVEAAPRPSGGDARTNALNNAFGGGGDPFVEDMSNPQRVLNALKLIEKLLLNPDAHSQVAVFIEQAELICPDMDRKGVMSAVDREILGILSFWGRDIDLQTTDNPIFLLCGKLNELHADLRSSNSGMKVIDIPLPNSKDRLAFLKRYLAERDKAKPIPFLDLTIEELARSTAGLNLRHVEDILMLAYRSGGVTRQIVRARKDEIISSEFSEIAEMIDELPEGLAALGGMEHIIAWIQAEIIDPIRQGRYEDVSDNNLLVGPPGTGKTFLVRALAGALSYPAVALKPEKILGRYVGQSEGNLQKFFGFVKAIAPCVVFFDEPDQSNMTNRGQEGDPVGGSLFGQMLRFMGEDNGQVIFMFASNRPDKMDSALQRSGRMKAIVPVLLPKESARQGILRAQARRQKIAITEEAVELGAGERTNDFSAADLEAIISKARKLARREERTEISVADMERALNLIHPNTPEIAWEYTLLAIRACNDAELLPPEYAALLDDRPGLAAKIKEASEEYVAPSREDRSL